MFEGDINTMRTETAQPQSAPREKLDVFTIVERENTKPFWVRIGVAFRNKDGSLNLYLDALPVNGRLNVRVADKDKAASDSAAE
jgi:hypothetical protein